MTVVVCLGLLVACQSTSSGVVTGTAVEIPGTSVVPTTAGSSTTTGSTSTSSVSSLQWTASDTDGVQTSSLKVPFDYNDPSKGEFDLFLARHLADPKQRIGSLLVNPGGPGFGGSDLAFSASNVYNKSLLDHFDIVAWDPRGTGESTPYIDCVSNYDHFFNSVDIPPDTPAARQNAIDIAKEFAHQCELNNGSFLQYVGTNNSARDMDSIRKALGEATISYFGFSYGSELGAVWATLFPRTVRAMVIDGASDPTASSDQSGVEQAQGFEHSFNTFLAQCSAKSSCAFHNDGKAEAAYDALAKSIDATPIATKSGRPNANLAMLITAVSDAMYSDQSWPALATALKKAQAGDGSGLLGLSDDYYQRRSDGTYDNSLEAFQVISCADTPDRPTVADDDAASAMYRKVAPRLSPGTIGSYFCTFFPKALDPEVTITGKGAGSVVVVGTTGDPATPLAGTRQMARTLEGGHLVVVKADQHTGYGANSCVDNAVDQYLIDPKGHVPADETTCS